VRPKFPKPPQGGFSVSASSSIGEAVAPKGVSEPAAGDCSRLFCARMASPAGFFYAQGKSMSTNTQPDFDLKDEKAAAEFLQVKPGTLQVWRSTRRYPLPFVKIGRKVRYRMSDLQAFVNARAMGGEQQ
jgi:hypothetical protein